jgi:hypothetical protein
MSVSAILIGGLGNQLFVAATAYALALDNNDECGFRFDSKMMWYQRGQGNGASYYKTTIYKKLKELPANWKPEFTYRESSSYKPIPYRRNILLDGYFSQLYFDHRKAEVIDLFKDKDTLNQIRGQFKNSVSIHIRHGDYLKSPNIYIQLPLDYYIKALSLLDQKTQIDRIYVLSDDIKWCKANFRDDRIEFIEGFPDYIDLYIMTKCTHNIIANSSFSWWGAYMNENPDHVVYVPAKWFGAKGPQGYEHLFCKNWIRL